jgi:hypothetical protein
MKVWADWSDFAQDALRGGFWPLALFSVISATTLWRRVAWPAIQDGKVWRYSIGVGSACVSLALALECLTYGLVRWLPAQWGWLGQTYEWVMVPKLIYLGGILMIETANAPEDKRRDRMVWLSLAAMVLWAAGVGTAVYLAE